MNLATFLVERGFREDQFRKIDPAKLRRAMMLAQKKRDARLDDEVAVRNFEPDWSKAKYTHADVVFGSRNTYFGMAGIFDDIFVWEPMAYTSETDRVSLPLDEAESIVADLKPCRKFLFSITVEIQTVVDRSLLRIRRSECALSKVPELVAEFRYPVYNSRLSDKIWGRMKKGQAELYIQEWEKIPEIDSPIKVLDFTKPAPEFGVCPVKITPSDIQFFQNINAAQQLTAYENQKNN